MLTYYFDTECCGFHGPIVTIQYAINDNDPVLWEVWRRPILETMALIEDMMQNRVVAFNLAFDHFHLCQLYTTMSLYSNRYPEAEYLDPERYAQLEPEARDLGCLKPAECCDVMLQVRKGPYQSTMDRKNIYIRKVPAVLASQVCAWLNENLPFEPLYFSRRKVKGSVWRIQETKDEKFVNVYVSFAPSTALKPLIENVFGEKTVSYDVVGVPRKYAPLELGYAPYALAVTQLSEWKGERKAKFKGPWKGSWPSVIEYYIRHWGFNPTAQKYATDDVVYTRKLYKHFEFEPNDDDSVLAAMVGAVRWRGFRVDLEGLKELRQIAIDAKVIKEGKYAGEQVPTAPRAAYKYLLEVMEPVERLTLTEADLDDTTNREALEEIISWETDVSKRAQEIYDARRAQKEIELYDKLLLAGRFHASFKVLGTLSSRMAGADKLNPQGIKKTKLIRSKFPLYWEGQELCGGDFAGFEVTIADAVYDDPDLRKALLSDRTCSKCKGHGCNACDHIGKVRTKIHALFGTFIMPDLTYDEICASDGQSPDYYTICKSALFTWLFAGTEYSMHKRLGIPMKQGKAGIEAFGQRFQKVGKTRAKIMEEYCPIHQPENSNFAYSWRDHKTIVSTLLGFDRYFTLEFHVLKTFYALSQNIPEEWKRIHMNVVRNDRVQTAVGAFQSALYGACFSLQNQIARAAINTPIQGTGAQITKRVQRNIWELQPIGYNKWIVQPMNIHDEVLCVTAKTHVNCVDQVVAETVEDLTNVIPLLEIDWNSGLRSWAEKKRKSATQPPPDTNMAVGVQ